MSVDKSLELLKRRNRTEQNIKEYYHSHFPRKNNIKQYFLYFLFMNSIKTSLSSSIKKFKNYVE